MFNFEKLDVCTKAIVFADLVYSVARRFPVEERFRLTNQIRRAAVSVSSNIAEGSGRVCKTDFAHCVQIATDSLFDVVWPASVSKGQGFLNDGGFASICSQAEKSAVERLEKGPARRLMERGGRNWRRFQLFTFNFP